MFFFRMVWCCRLSLCWSPFSLFRLLFSSYLHYYILPPFSESPNKQIIPIYYLIHVRLCFLFRNGRNILLEKTTPMHIRQRQTNPISLDDCHFIIIFPCSNLIFSSFLSTLLRRRRRRGQATRRRGGRGGRRRRGG